MATRAFLALILLISSALAQTPPRCSAKDEVKSIQDNSFLIEEAYNQEDGVVQHINTFSRQHDGNWIYTFTQEWPLFGVKHQFSFTIPVLGLSSLVDDVIGLGDVALNYRYQLIGNGEARLAMAPRFSLLLPTGDRRRELDARGIGTQLSVPISLVISRHLVTHWNAGMTFTTSANNNGVEGPDHTYYNLGQSFVWLAKPNFNVLFETIWVNLETVIGPGITRRSNNFLINPGIRWAYNFKNGLQIVPGIALPTGLGSNKGDRGFLLYLSFEHPFRKQRE